MSDARDDIPTDPISDDRTSRQVNTDYSGQFTDEGEIQDGDTYVTDEDLNDRVADIPPDPDLNDLADGIEIF